MARTYEVVMAGQPADPPRTFRTRYFPLETGRIGKGARDFRKLLKMDPTDHQGVRLYVLAIRMDLERSWEDNLGLSKRPAAKDARKTDAWFKRNINKFPEEFEWLFKG